MKRKKMVKISLLVIAVLVVIGLIYVISSIYGIHKMNAWNDKIGETLPETFRIELPVIKSLDGYFCVRCTVNEQFDADYIMDTQATSIVKTENITNRKATLWGYFPVPVHNFYGQKEKNPLYYFDSFKIQSLSFNKPLFESISKSNAMYDLMDNGVVGKDILKQLYWKFALDDDKIILFSNKDSVLFQKETENYTKIKNGLTGSNNALSFPDISKQSDFMFDLGYAGEIMVNKDIFIDLSTKFKPQIYVSTRSTSVKNDTTYVFDKINIEWEGIKIPNCLVIYRSITNRNLIGAALINRFNFILAYNDKTNNRIENNLYLQPRNNFQNFVSLPYCSDFGFLIGKSENGFIVRNIKIGGLADQSGVNIKDKIVSIDHGNFDLNNRKQLDSYLADKNSVTLTIERDRKNIDITIEK